MRRAKRGGELYLPVLEALDHLCEGPDGEKVIVIHRRYAPTWLLQFPKFVDDAEVVTLRRKIAGATRTRMLRELTDALTALTAETGVVLVLDDLQWSDPSTIEFLLFLARQKRRDPLRLMIIGMHRPVEAENAPSSLKAVIHELTAHGQCENLPLSQLGPQAIDAYIQKRFEGYPTPPELSPLTYQHTGGNPLFMVNLVQDLVTQGLLVETEGRWVFTKAIKDTEIFLPGECEASL